MWSFIAARLGPVWQFSGIEDVSLVSECVLTNGTGPW